MNSHLNTTQWQRIQAIVNQHPQLIQSNLKNAKTKLILSRFLTETLLVLLLQYTGLMFTTLSTHLFPVWFASGTATAFIFLRGVSVLPGIGLGSFLAYYLAHAGITISILSAIVYMLQAYVLLIACYYFIAPTLIFYQFIQLAKFILLSGVITAFMSWVLIYFSHQDWLYAWLANFNGIFIVSSAIIAWDAYFPEWGNLKKVGHYYKRCSVLAIVFLLSLFFTLTIDIARVDWSYAFIISLQLMLGLTTFLGLAYAVERK